MDKYSTCASSWSMGSLEQSDLVMDMIHGNTVWPYFVILCLHIFKASWTMKVLLKQTWSGVWYIEWWWLKSTGKPYVAYCWNLMVICTKALVSGTRVVQSRYMYHKLCQLVLRISNSVTLGVKIKRTNVSNVIRYRPSFLI